MPQSQCRLGFPIRPDYEVGVSRGSVCSSRGELGIRRGESGRVGIGREGNPTKNYMLYFERVQLRFISTGLGQDKSGLSRCYVWVIRG